MLTAASASRRPSSWLLQEKYGEMILYCLSSCSPHFSLFHHSHLFPHSLFIPFPHSSLISLSLILTSVPVFLSGFALFRYLYSFSFPNVSHSCLNLLDLFFIFFFRFHSCFYLFSCFLLSFFILIIFGSLSFPSVSICLAFLYFLFHFSYSPTLSFLFYFFLLSFFLS